MNYEMENYNENSKGNISKICSLVNQSISETNKNKFNKYLWLKEINIQLIHIFTVINKSFINGTHSDEKPEKTNQQQVTENCLLYGDQILKCLNQFKNIFAYEYKYNVVLKSSTQFLADHLLMCLEKMNSLSALSTKNSKNIDKLLDNLDYVFNFMNLLQNKDPDELSDEIDQFNKSIFELLSQSWEFACFLDDADKLIIKNICNKILKNTKALMDNFNSSTESDTNVSIGNVKFKLDLLYSAVLCLEVNLNDCFLRLMFDTFSYLETAPLKAIMNKKIPKEVDLFDLANERLMQIAVYAAYYTNDIKIKSKILSGLVTMESLDAYLVPTVMSESKEFRNLLVKTWESTVKSLQYHIHCVIDTVPFLNGIDGILMKFLEIPKNTLTLNEVNNIIFKLKVISKHFYINACDYDDEEINKQMNNFKLMVRELEAINECFEKVDRIKIIKRVKIIKTILKKTSAIIETDNLCDTETFRSSMRSTQANGTFVKKTKDSAFDLELTNILNEFLLLSE